MVRAVKILLTFSVIFMSASAALAQNGDFESWSGGAPQNWSRVDGVTTTQVAGWTGFAARIGLGAGSTASAALTQSVSPSQADQFGVAFDFAQAPSGSERGMNVTLRSGTTPLISLRVSADGAIQVFDGSTWRSISDGGIVASGALDAPDPAKVYRVSISGSLSAARYSVRVERTGESEVLLDAQDLNFWQTSPTGLGFSAFRFERGRSGGDYLVDNVEYLSPPPPPSSEVTHPFLLFEEEDVAGLRSLANGGAHASMAAQAVDRATHLAYDPNLAGYRARALRLKEVVASLALAAVVDGTTDPSVYAARFHDQLVTGLNHLGSNRPNSWDGNTPVASMLFDAILALDVLHASLTESQRSAVEALLNQWVPSVSGWEPSPQSVRALWALYLGDPVGYTAQRNAFLSHFFGKFTADGVASAGTNYALARMAYYDREQKHLLLEIIRRHDGLTSSQEAQIQRAYEWLFGYAMGPHGWNHVFGDTSPNRRFNGALEYPLDSPTAVYLTDSLSTDARAYANRNLLAATPAPSIMAYVGLDPRLSTVPAAFPPSRIFADGGAWLQSDRGAHGALSAAMWNMTKTESHTHKETNALSVAAYGELLLSNAGYAGFNTGALGFSWNYINNRAISGNTVLVDYPLTNAASAPSQNDHSQKRGNGIVQSLISDEIDYAKGHSGPALPNGTHQRHLLFIHAQDGLPGYFVVLDEVQGNSGAQQTHAAWHPFSPQLSTLSTGEHYRATCQQFSAVGVDLHLHLTTPPSATQVLDGLIAQFNGLSFVGKFLYPTYALGTGQYRRFGTVLYPHATGMPLPLMQRVSGAGFDATKFLWADGTEDLWVVAQAGGPVEPAPGLAFSGKAAWFRIAPGGQVNREMLVEGTSLSSANGTSSISASSAATWVAGPGGLTLPTANAPSLSVQRPGIGALYPTGAAPLEAIAGIVTVPAGGSGFLSFTQDAIGKVHLEMGSGGVSLHGTGLDPSRKYRWKSSPDLQSWSSLGGLIQGKTQSHAYDHHFADRQFYRLELSE